MLAKPLGYCVQFRPYAGKDTQLDVYDDIGLGVGGTVVVHQLKYIQSQQDNGFIYHMVMDKLLHLQKFSVIFRNSQLQLPVQLNFSVRETLL